MVIAILNGEKKDKIKTPHAVKYQANDKTERGRFTRPFGTENTSMRHIPKRNRPNKLLKKTRDGEYNEPCT